MCRPPIGTLRLDDDETVIHKQTACGTAWARGGPKPRQSDGGRSGSRDNVIVVGRLVLREGVSNPFFIHGMCRIHQPPSLWIQGLLAKNTVDLAPSHAFTYKRLSYNDMSSRSSPLSQILACWYIFRHNSNGLLLDRQLPKSNARHSPAFDNFRGKISTICCQP
jgi:hypothetical protein